jgi:hypothetical protein
MRNTADVSGGKPIAVLLQSISGVSSINPLVAFYDIHGGTRERCYSFILSGTPNETNLLTIFINSFNLLCKLIYFIKFYVSSLSILIYYASKHKYSRYACKSRLK